jgi:hypothetical protein
LEWATTPRGGLRRRIRKGLNSHASPDSRCKPMGGQLDWVLRAVHARSRDAAVVPGQARRGRPGDCDLWSSMMRRRTVQIFVGLAALLVADPGTWAEDRGPDWSPDGKRSAFTRLVWLCPRCDEDEIFSVNADGSDVMQLTPDTGTRSGPSWSPVHERATGCRTTRAPTRQNWRRTGSVRRAVNAVA